jgi:hypothetical protein
LSDIEPINQDELQRKGMEFLTNLFGLLDEELAKEKLVRPDKYNITLRLTANQLDKLNSFIKLGGLEH